MMSRSVLCFSTKYVRLQIPGFYYFSEGQEGVPVRGRFITLTMDQSPGRGLYPALLCWVASLSLSLSLSLCLSVCPGPVQLSAGSSGSHGHVGFDWQLDGLTPHLTPALLIHHEHPILLPGAGPGYGPLSHGLHSGSTHA